MNEISEGSSKKTGARRILTWCENDSKVDLGSLMRLNSSVVLLGHNDCFLKGSPNFLLGASCAFMEAGPKAGFIFQSLKIETWVQPVAKSYAGLAKRQSYIDTNQIPSYRIIRMHWSFSACSICGGQVWDSRRSTGASILTMCAAVL